MHLPFNVLSLDAEIRAIDAAHGAIGQVQRHFRRRILLLVVVGVEFVQELAGRDDVEARGEFLEQA